MPAKIMEHNTLTWASPPFQCPTQTRANEKIRSAIPQAFMMLPAIMKKKMESRLHVMDPSMTPCARIWMG